LIIIGRSNAVKVPLSEWQTRLLDQASTYVKGRMGLLTARSDSLLFGTSIAALKHYGQKDSIVAAVALGSIGVLKPILLGSEKKGAATMSESAGKNQFLKKYHLQSKDIKCRKINRNIVEISLQ